VSVSPLGRLGEGGGYSLGMRALKRRVKPLPLAAMAVAAALASALGGCGGGGPATNGPLSSGADGGIARGNICVTRVVSRLQTFGDEQFTNGGHATVVLDRVALQHPHDEHLIGSYAVPGTLLIGVVPWPPKYAGMPSTWKHRQPVHGFRLAPGKSFNMVLGVTATAPGLASSRGMLVYYHYSTGSYVARDDFAMIIAVTRNGCLRS
jgi:hypothetical protein